MVLYGRKWYRARVMEQGDTKVLLEYQGFSHEGGPFWLAKDHPRIWRGSYKGKDWRYLVGVVVVNSCLAG
jgi:predicted NUDIX family NTP pyrophosphohydrolase